jgi:hypothetical protein
MDTRIITALIATGALAACTTVQAPRTVEGDFGNSARSLVKAQTANPETLTAPSDAPVTGVEPDYANKTIEEFREGVSKPEDVRRPVQIRVGTSSSNY